MWFFYFLFFCSGEAKVDLLKEFPDPKGLLNYTISRSLGVSDLSELIQYSYTERAGIKVRAWRLACISSIGYKVNSTFAVLLPQKATVTLQWPCKIEEQGHASKRIDAERFAAAAACLKLRVSKLMKRTIWFCIILKYPDNFTENGRDWSR